jgi:predicted nucleotidyltransferase
VIHHPNIERIKSVASLLGDLNEKVVFVGGATLSLYASRKTFEVRPTDDVDVIVEILNYAQRAALEDKLRSIGFSNDITSGVICRWNIENIIVDIMPTEDPSVGFTNKWYPQGYRNAINYRIDDRCTIRILDTPHFLATKLEAFKGRGKNDGRTSHDFEDIIYVLENRPEIWQELDAAGKDVKEYLISEFRGLVDNPNILEWIDCNVERGSPPATYIIHEKLKNLLKLPE